MASSVQFENTYPEDERWIDAGADAFALHFAACCYSDRHNKDGLIPKSMVSRVALAVPPENVQAAAEALVRAGFWASAGTSYRIINFLEDKIGLSSDEKLANRQKWAEDKRWRRRHNAGNHDQCPPDKCRISGKTSQSDTAETLDGIIPGVAEHDPTRLDTTRLDSTRLRSRRGRGSGPDALNGPALASAGAPAAASPGRREADGVDGRFTVPDMTLPVPDVITSEMLAGMETDGRSREELEYYYRVIHTPDPLAG